MSTESTYADFLAHIKQTTALSQVAGLLSWDQEVMMPEKGADARAEQLSVLARTLHEKQTDPRLGDLLGELEEGSLDSVSRQNVALARRDFDRTSKVPTDLAAELARTRSLAHRSWAKARADSNFAAFAPSLESIVRLKREEADCIADIGQSPYDALLSDFEPGMDVATLEPLLEGMRPRLMALRENIAEKCGDQPHLDGPFDHQSQMDLARTVATGLGYDWQAGRLDLSTHPFSSGTGGDSRITTRVDQADPLGCLYSTIHEVGHALYEQGLPRDHTLTPLGQHVSMGVHESQSRLWENQVGRSRAYVGWLAPRFAEAFPHTKNSADPDTLYRVINRVETGFVRTESDEVHYNLHVLLRFELERDLIAGDLEVADLEAEWNRRFENYFGLAVPNAALGVLQDVHWSEGLFGYFPTYSLGNIYAAQLDQALRRQLSDIDGAIEQGETGQILDWLRHNIHQKGSSHPPEKIIEDAVGEPVSSDPSLDYLEAKYADLFGF